MKNDQNNLKKITWTPTQKRSVLKTRIMEVFSQESISPENNTSSFIVVDAPNWVITVAVLDKQQSLQDFNINEETFLMVSQWRHGNEKICTEFPGGVIDPCEKPQIAAKRELLEETGYEAKSITHLASLSPNPAIFSNTLHIYLAENLINTKKLQLDNDEYVTATAIPIKEVIKNIGNSDYQHGLMATALMFYIQSKI